MRDFLLSYDTVTLFPEHSELPSRSKADTSLTFCGWEFRVPVVPANMADVIDLHNAEYLSENGYFYIYHRFGEGEEHTLNFIKDYQGLKLVSISIGVNQESINIVDAIKGQKWRVDFITIDVAHADHENVKHIIKHIRKTLPETKLIVGNVATAGGFAYLCDLNVDAIKVGIGGGSICTTRYMTGFHLPTLQSLYEIQQWQHSNTQILGHPKVIPQIIADGGAKHYGDVAKAITFGASMVMSGGWFASCIDSPAKIVNGKKVYRGSTSYELKGHKRHVEGRQLELMEGTTFQQRLTEIEEALQSSISYAGGNDLSAFESVRWGRILPFH
jgi:GMP reductase